MKYLQLFPFLTKGNTPLHEACFFGRDDAVKELLQAGANWKFVNKLGWTPLHVGKYLKRLSGFICVCVCLASCTWQLSHHC